MVWAKFEWNIYPELTPGAYFGKWSMYFQNSYQLPLEKDEPLYLNKLVSPVPKIKTLCQV